MSKKSILPLLPSLPIILMIAAVGAGLLLALNTMDVFAQPSSSLSTLSKENPSLVVEGQTLNTTADDLDIDLTIHPNDNITDPSRTETISTEGATDIDINAIPEEGRTVIIQNGTVTVTEQPVSISGGEAVAEEASNPATISGD